MRAPIISCVYGFIRVCPYVSMHKDVCENGSPGHLCLTLCGDAHPAIRALIHVETSCVYMYVLMCMYMREELNENSSKRMTELAE